MNHAPKVILMALATVAFLSGCATVKEEPCACCQAPYSKTYFDSVVTQK